jgi:tetraacyldisaccharide 4'-kinase
MPLLRILLFPFSLVYGAVMFIRNKLYDTGILYSVKFDVPVISVGNLSMGGTGKTPHIEYLIQLLKSEFYISTLSRGYSRKTKGFLLADAASTANEIGDEPLQFKKKFQNIPVAVDENRVRGIKNILELFPSIQGILLDDAYQHRAVTAGMSIVLTDFNKLYSDDYVIPSGTLREFPSGIKRADIIIVTKCPHVPLAIERKGIISKLNPSSHQKIYFTTIHYGEFIPLNNMDVMAFSKNYYFEKNYSILLVSGIANITPLEYYLKEKTKSVTVLNFPDHHQFTQNDVKDIEADFHKITSPYKIIVTTEKDTMRFREKKLSGMLNNLPIFYIPIEILFCDMDGIAFNNQILQYVRTNQRNNNIH